MGTLAVDHSREVTSVLMIQTKMAHLRRLGHRVGWFGLLTTQQHSCRDGEALLQKWEADTLSFCLQSLLLQYI